ncbi:MAG: hypothetical protein JXA46_06045 [Dehalococcoidales bacterium]|nr:hypothetical protein [Dehalococcoidales bacterium]
MTSHDLLILIIIGSVFVLLGIIGFLWAKREERSYYSSITERIDVREFMDHLPWHPEPGSLKIGGIIIILVGITLLLIALGFHLWG